jgi:signal transduction histidine kinase
VSNAIKFSQEGGSILLRCIEITNTVDNKVQRYLRFECVDNGVGIKEEDKERLFKPFSQVNPHELQDGGGSGLGLSLTAAMISAVGGKAGAESRWARAPPSLSSCRSCPRPRRLRSASQCPPLSRPKSGSSCRRSR